MDVFEKYINYPGKTIPRLTIFEHSLQVLQVANYLIQRNSELVHHPQLVRAGALCHDAGKIAQHFRSGKWIHTPHTSDFLSDLLDHPRFKELLSLADANVADSDKELLLSVCETHHYHSPEVLRRCKEVILVPIADALASAIGGGSVGEISSILRASPYLQVGLELLKSLGFANGLDEEVHRVDLPNLFVQDVLLADMVFREFGRHVNGTKARPVLQQRGSLWVVGDSAAIRAALVSLKIDPKRLYNAVFEPEIFESILSELPSAGSMQADSLKYLLVNEAIASRLALALLTRRTIQEVLERNNLSHLADTTFDKGLADGIDSVWRVVRSKILELTPELTLPEALSDFVKGVANGDHARYELGIYAKPRPDGTNGSQTRSLSKFAQTNREVLEQMIEKAKKHSGEREREQLRQISDCGSLLKLFDASLNSYKSVTNVLLEFLKFGVEIASGTYSIPVAGVATLDGEALTAGGQVRNAALCPVCRRFPQVVSAQALITGNPKSDSSFHSSRTARSQTRICSWCFLAGYMDLPIASITKENQGVAKAREYLLVTSPISKNKLQWLVDFARRGHGQTDQDEDADLSKPLESELEELANAMGLGRGYDPLAVLGVSRNRLSTLKGFVLPTSNAIGNLVGIRIPVERLVGPERVSGAVAKELIKATMHDFHIVTGATSMHYGVVTEAQFSVLGDEINVDEMRRASIAYRIADRYARVGSYWHLNCGLFMLVLKNPRNAITRLLHSQRRAGYPPGEEKIKEILDMSESIAPPNWMFTLGQEITATLVEADLLPRARSFWKNQNETFSGVELTKWLQRFKIARDEASIRQWGTQLINALKAGRIASRDFREARGLLTKPPDEKTIVKIIRLVEHIIVTCAEKNCTLSDFSRKVSEMDYYLLFYHNQKDKRHDVAKTA